MRVIFRGRNGCRAADRILKVSEQSCLLTRVNGVVLRQKAARVFIAGLGDDESDRSELVKPWLVARWRSRWFFNLNSLNGIESEYVDNITK